MTPTEARTVTLTEDACKELMGMIFKAGVCSDTYRHKIIRSWFSTHTRGMVRDAGDALTAILGAYGIKEGDNWRLVEREIKAALPVALAYRDARAIDAASAAGESRPYSDGDASLATGKRTT